MSSFDSASVLLFLRLLLIAAGNPKSVMGIIPANPISAASTCESDQFKGLRLAYFPIAESWKPVCSPSSKAFKAFSPAADRPKVPRRPSIDPPSSPLTPFKMRPPSKPSSVFVAVKRARFFRNTSLLLLCASSREYPCSNRSRSVPPFSINASTGVEPKDH